MITISFSSKDFQAVKLIYLEFSKLNRHIEHSKRNIKSVRLGQTRIQTQGLFFLFYYKVSKTHLQYVGKSNCSDDYLRIVSPFVGLDWRKWKTIWWCIQENESKQKKWAAVCSDSRCGKTSLQTLLSSPTLITRLQRLLLTVFTSLSLFLTYFIIRFTSLIWPTLGLFLCQWKWSHCTNIRFRSRFERWKYDFFCFIFFYLYLHLNCSWFQQKRIT